MLKLFLDCHLLVPGTLIAILPCDTCEKLPQKIDTGAESISGGSRISETGEGPIIWQDFSRKLHENERIWTEALMNFCDTPSNLVDHLQIQDSAMYVPPPRWFNFFHFHQTFREISRMIGSHTNVGVRPGNPGSVTVSFCYSCRQDLRQFAQDRLKLLV